MNAAIRIRPYEPRDRAAVRQICCDTADRGEPVENFFPDRELIADLMTRYYTDYDTTTTWVAEENSAVVAYVTGCLDTPQWRRVTFGRIAPRAILGAIGRGVLFHAQTWRFLARLRPSSPVDLTDYPAHLHVNVARGFRGGEVGRQLVDTFRARAGSVGVHANVRRNNDRGRKFFEQLGFQPLHETDSTIVYAQKW